MSGTVTARIYGVATSTMTAPIMSYCVLDCRVGLFTEDSLADRLHYRLVVD